MNHLLHEEFDWDKLLQVGKDVATTGARYSDERSFSSKYSYSSAAKAASNLTAVFPVLCSTSCSRDTAALVTKAIERKAAMLLQLALTASNITNIRSGMEYLYQFHQNLNTSGMSAEDIIDKFDDYANKHTSTGSWVDSELEKSNKYGENTYNGKNESCAISMDVSSSQAREIQRMLIESYNQYFDEDTRSLSLNDYNIEESHSGYRISIRSIFTEADKDKSKDTDGEKSKSNKSKKTKEDYQLAKAKFDAETAAYKRSKAKADLSSQTGKNTAEFLGGGRIPQLRQDDVKKMNELVPMMLIVRFFNIEAKATQEFIVGVKAKCIRTMSEEIVKKVYNNNKDSMGLVNLIRATTGEIKFVADFLLGLDQTKADVMSINKKGSNEDVWHALQTRAQNAKVYLRQKKTNYASAITTVVITQEDADYIYKQLNININSSFFAKRFMKAYNLLGFCIVDDTIESAKFLWDDESNKFEEVAYTMLEREEKDAGYKKIINLLAKMR